MFYLYKYIQQVYYNFIAIFFYRQELDLVVLGYPNSGKTTLCDIISGGHESFQIDKIPTIGIDYKYVTKGRLLIKMMDLSGQERFHNTLWRQYYEDNCDIIIYLIDLSDPLSWIKAKQKLIEIIVRTEEEEDLRCQQIPIAIIGNKVDLVSDNDFINMAGVTTAAKAATQPTTTSPAPAPGAGAAVQPAAQDESNLNRLECFYQFLGIHQETPDKFVLKRKVSSAASAGKANATTGGGGGGNIMIEHNEEEIREIYRDIGVFLISCKEMQNIDELLTWIIGR